MLPEKTKPLNDQTFPTNNKNPLTLSFVGKIRLFTDLID